MKKVLLFFLFPLFVYSQGGIRLYQIQAHTIGGVRQDSSFVMTGSDGRLNYISLDSLNVIVNKYFDLCDELNEVEIGTLDTSEYFLQSDCKRVKLSEVTNGDLFTCVRVLECIQEDCEGIRECVTSIIDCEYIDSCVSLSDFDCDSVAACLDEILCDRVLACLEDSLDISDIVCNAFNSFIGRAGEVGDSIIVTNGGICAKIPFTEAMGRGDYQLYVRDSSCIDLEMLNDTTLTAIVLISGDANNNIECRGDGLFSANNCEEFSTAPMINLENDAGYFFYVNKDEDPDMCYKSELKFAPGDCINLQMVDGAFRADIEISPNAGNIITCVGNGLYATADTTGQDNSWLCDSLSSLDLGDDLQINDYVVGIEGGNSCKLKQLTAQSTCPNEPPVTTYIYVVVQDEGGNCVRITCAAFKTFLNGGSCI